METVTTPIWQTHKDFLTEQGVDFEKIIELRKHFHKYAEGGFKEFDTQRKIRETLVAFGLDTDCIKDWAGTGLVVDIVGTGPESTDGDCNWVAFRADIDALEMKEETGLDYASVTDFAHMWGHDGHIATLLATTQFWAKHRDKIPTNKSIRLLFQPAEEKPGGAEPMIREGCMDGVDEIYGYHNLPLGLEGSITIWHGPFMSGGVNIKIEIIGQGGHGSEPAKSIDPITTACHLHSALHTIKSRNLENRELAIFTIGQLTSGSTYNVIPRTATMWGMVRYFDDTVKAMFIDRITAITKSTCEGFNCEYNLEITDFYPQLINKEKQTQIVHDIAKAELGEDNINTKDFLPLFASDDFAYFLHKAPGVYIGLNSLKPDFKIISPHSPYMNFNDNIISTGAYLNIRISEHRLGISLL